MILLDGCRHEAYKEEAFFQCGAVELGKKLLGKYLYCHQSDFLVRIVETEAYPRGDEIYKELFETGPPFPNQAGVILQLSSALHHQKPLHSKGENHHLYITAGDTGASRDVVLLRSCEPYLQGETGYDLHTEDELRMMKTILERLSVRRTSDQRKNLLVNPDIVALVLAKDLEGNTVLYEGGGVQLFHKVAEPVATESDLESDSVPHDTGPAREPDSKPDLEPILHGPRLLSEPIMELGSTIESSSDSGVEQKYRFALELGYNYAQKKSLERMT